MCIYITNMDITGKHWLLYTKHGNKNDNILVCMMKDKHVSGTANSCEIH